MLNAPELLKRLSQNKVEYVVIGGLAMITHGSAHITKDLDFCYRRTPENLTALATAFGDLHPYLRGVPPGLPFRFDVATLRAGLNFTLDTDLGAVDIFGEVPGLGDFDAVAARSTTLELFNTSVRVLSLEGLIAAKKAAGRIKDQLHLVELEELSKLQSRDI